MHGMFMQKLIFLSDKAQVIQPLMYFCGTKATQLGKEKKVFQS